MKFRPLPWIDSRRIFDASASCDITFRLLRNPSDRLAGQARVFRPLSRRPIEIGALIDEWGIQQGCWMTTAFRLTDIHSNGHLYDCGEEVYWLSMLVVYGNQMSIVEDDWKARNVRGVNSFREVILHNLLNIQLCDKTEKERRTTLSTI